MLRGYRSIVLAALIGLSAVAFGLGSYLAFLALSGATPKQEYGINGQPRQQAGEAVAAAADYAPYPDINGNACYGSKNHDTADLCAQWRAAIAAEKAAEGSHSGNIIGGVGALLSFIGIVLVVIALRQTEKSLGEAKDANLIAADTAKRQLRAYLSIKSATISPAQNRGNFWVAHVNLINSGATPAHDVQFSVVSATGPKEQVISQKPDIDWDNASRTSVGPNTEIGLSIEIGEITPSDACGIKNGSYSIIVFGEVRYADSFGKDRTTLSRHEVYLRGERNSVELTVSNDGNSMT